MARGRCSSRCVSELLAEIVDQSGLAPCCGEKSDARGDPQIMAAVLAKMLRDQIALGECRDAAAAARASVAQSAAMRPARDAGRPSPAPSKIRRIIRRKALWTELQP